MKLFSKNYSTRSHADTVVLEHGTESKEMHVHSGVLRKEPWSDQSNVTIQYLLGGYKSPSTTAVDGEGSIYVANYSGNRIDRITKDGKGSTFSSGLNYNGPIGIVISHSGVIYVANHDSGTILNTPPFFTEA
jgi:hypothetical protein